MERIIFALLLVGLSSCCLADPAPGTREVLLENDSVEVVRLTYPPGSESGMHAHAYPHRVVYVARGGRLEMVPEDAQALRQVLEVTEGQVAFMPAATHNVRNVGETEVVLIETEIK